MTNYNFELKTGNWYWYRRRADRTWRICYIGEDSDKNQLMFLIDQPSLQLDRLDLNFFDFANVDPPPNPMPRTIGDMINDFAWQNPEYIK